MTGDAEGHVRDADGDTGAPIVDVEALVDSLRARAARLRADGAYGAPVGDGPLALPPAGAAGAPRVVFRPQLGYSSKPVVGRPITAAKQVTLRALFHVLDDLARQTDAAVARTWIHAEEAARSAAQNATGTPGLLDGVRAALDAEGRAREAVARDVQALSRRLDEFERRVEELQLAPRLARLERARRDAAAAPPPTSPAAAPAPAAPLPALDYEAFEGRFRPEAAVREHQRDYADLLRGARRVVDLGCGRGELIEMLVAEGVDAYGVELEQDFVDLAAARGLRVLHGDGIAHLEGLEPATVDGVVASHVVEHLPPGDVLRLVAAAARALAPGGTLILETPNPESLVAGSVNFHRDLTHRRPIHPDTLAFLCESAGFSDVAVRRLSPVPDAERLPVPPADATGGAHLRPVVERLNALVFGFQDYAVVARA